MGNKHPQPGTKKAVQAVAERDEPDHPETCSKDQNSEPNKTVHPEVSSKDQNSDLDETVHPEATSKDQNSDPDETVHPEATSKDQSSDHDEAVHTEELSKDHNNEPDEDSHDGELEDQDDSEDSEDETLTKTPPVSLNLKLYCATDEAQSRSVKIVTPCTPITILDVKLCVENELSIPACCQELSFESQKLRDCDSVEVLKIREGDTLTINYESEGMVEDVREIIKGMKSMNRFLRKKTIRKRLENGSGCDTEISNNLDTVQVESLASAYFHPSADPRSKANRLFFVSNNGLQIMHQLHAELLRYPWDKCVLEMQYLEHSILRVLWNLSAAFSIRLLLLERPTLEAVIKSLVRVEIPANSFFQGPIGSSYEYKRITSEMLYKAVGTIGNLAEIPNCRVAIASRKDVLDQLLATLTSPTYTYIASLVASAGLLCLAYSPETHQYLIKDNVIRKFDKACDSVKHHTHMDEQLLKYFRCVFYALLLSTSPAMIPTHAKLQMKHAMKNFLESADYETIREHEKKKGYIWSTVAHFVKLVYIPKQSSQWSICTPKEVIAENNELEDLCIEAGVFSLQNVLLSNDTREILKAESLVDYIVCMPWHLSPDTKAHVRACALRQFLSSKMQLQPPTLVNLAKAKLAVSHCGLERVVKARGLHDIVAA